MNSRKRIPTLLALTVPLAIFASLRVTAAETNLTSAKWEPDIQAFEASDKTNPPPHGPVLFVGSSSIRLWETLARDFPRHKVINRGFGGSQIADSVAFADRIILAYKPKIVVLYAGDNDIASGKSPEQVFPDFKALVEKIHAALPKTRIVFISIKPSPSRWLFADKVRAANQLIEAYCRQSKRLSYIDVFNPMLGADGNPRPELFIADSLHMNAKGYALWTKLVESSLR